MWEGSFEGARLQPMESAESKWEDSTPFQRDIALGILDTHLELGQADAVLRGEDAFRKGS